MRRLAHVTVAALAGIDQIGLFTTEKFGERQAERQAETIDMAIAEIAADPTSLRSRHRIDVHTDAWTMHVSRRGRRASRFVLYRVRADGIIKVARVLRDSMDLRRHLPADFGSSSNP